MKKLTKEEHYRKVLSMVSSITHSYKEMGLYKAEEAMDNINYILTQSYKEYEKTFKG